MAYFFCYRCLSCVRGLLSKNYFNRVSEEEEMSPIKQLVYILLNGVFLLTVFLCLFDYFLAFFTALRVGKDQPQFDSDKWPQPSKSVM